MFVGGDRGYSGGEDIISGATSSGVMSAWKEPSREQIKESEFLRQYYGKSRAGEIWEDISKPVGNLFGNIGTNLGYLKTVLVGKKKTTEEEMSSLIIEPTERMEGATGTYRLPTTEELSPGAGYYKTALIEEVGAGLSYKTKYEQKRDAILGRISEDNIITTQEASLGNIELESYSKELAKEYNLGYESREKVRQERFFPEKKGLKFLPEWNFEPEEFARKSFFMEEKEGLGKIHLNEQERMASTKVGTGALTFASGFYGGLREKPLKTALTLGAFIALPPVLKGGKYLAGVTGATKIVSAYPKTSALIGKGVQYGMGGLYGVSVVGRVALTPGIEKWGTAGEIISTEILPMGAGLKVGGYGVRRYELSSELRGWTKQLSPTEKIEFLSALKEAKAYSKFKPNVEEINLGRLKLVEKYPNVQEELINYFRGRKGNVIVGGSIAQQTQIRGVATKRPGDIDVYVKSMIGEELMGKRYAQDVGNILKRGGLKDIKISGGKVSIGGEKFAEFHPYKSYLRANIEQVSPWYKFASSGITKTPSGIRVPKINIQWQRKLIGGYLEKYISGKLRLKDLPAAEAIKKSMQMESMEIKQVGLFYDKRGVFRLSESPPQISSKKKVWDFAQVKEGWRNVQNTVNKMEILPKDLRTMDFSIKGGEGVSDYVSYKSIQEIYPYKKVGKLFPSIYPIRPLQKDILYAPYTPSKKMIPTPKFPEETIYPIRPSRRFSPFTSIYTPKEPPPFIIFGGGGGEIVPSSPSKKSKEVITGKIQIGLPKAKELIRGERLFVETPTLLGSLAWDLGLKQPRARTKKEISFGLPRESPFRRTSLPKTMLWKVQKKEFETFPKMKSYIQELKSPKVI